MIEQPKLTYLLVGTVTKDLQPDDTFTIGGTVTYASTVATRASADFVPPAHLSDISWHVLPDTVTTTYRNDYYPTGRVQTIGPIAKDIGPADIPVEYQQSDIVHLCPLAQDVDSAVATVFDQAMLTATPQGWLRQWDERGVVSLGGWQILDAILPKLRAAVISIEDVEGDWEIAKGWASKLSILVVTEGEAGATVFYHGESKSVPPRPAQPVDLTGAGDVFSAAFFIRLYETGDVLQSARFANVIASMALERLGVEGVPDRSEIESYLADNPL